MLDTCIIDPMNPTGNPLVPETAPYDWQELHLECKPWTESTLELRLEHGDSVLGRCLATRHDHLYLDAPGTDWARELLEEAVQEWRRGLPDPEPEPAIALSWAPLAA